MSNPFRKSTVIVTAVTLACFGAGFATSGAAHGLEHHRAVNQAVAAAQEVDQKRQELEQSIDSAQGVVDQAAPVADDVRVKIATRTLSAVTVDALDVASENIFDELSETVGGESDPTPVTALESAEPPSAEILDSTTGTANERDASDQSQDEVIAQVLESGSDDIAAARDATKKLKEVSDALDAARAEVEENAASVLDATGKANLVADNAALDATLSGIPDSIESAHGILEAVGSRVVDAKDTATVMSTTASLEKFAANVETADRDDAEIVSAQLLQAQTLMTALDTHLEEVSNSHQSWVDAENDRRIEVNQLREEEYDETLKIARETHAEQNLTFASDRANGWTGQPTQITGTNGRLTRANLCPVAFAPGQFLQCDAAAALVGADADYFEETGRHLKMTDSYRSYGLQVRTRARKPSTAAVPGTSNHGWGMAVDLDGASASWLSKNGPKYGWVHPAWAHPTGAKPESWHLEYVAPEVGGFVPPERPTLLEPVESDLAVKKPDAGN